MADIVLPRRWVERWGVALAAALCASCSVPNPEFRKATPTTDGGAPQEAARATTALVGWWKFDEATGTLAADSSGNGQNGQLVGTPPDGVHVPGHRGNALKLDGKGWVVVPRSAVLDSITGAVTLAAWVRFDAPIDRADYAIAARQYRATVNEHYGLFIESSGRLLACVNPGCLPTPFLTTGAWVHVAMTYDRVTEIAFTDGQPAGRLPTDASLLADTTPFNIGGQSDDTSGAGATQSRLVGLIDDVVLFRRALSPAEVARLVAGADPTTF